MTVHAPRCAGCGAVAVRVEVVAPGEQPQDFADWPASRRELYPLLTRRDQWRLIIEGISGSNGPAGEQISESEALDLIAMLDPFDAARVAARFPDRLGQCLACDKPYCADCWSGNAHGCCPRGHPGALASGIDALAPAAADGPVPEPDQPAVGAVLAEVRRAHLDVQAAEHLLRLAVRQALQDGASWSTIAASIGLSEHVARERFEYLVPGTMGTPDPSEEPR